MIQTRLKDGWKVGCIADEIGCAANTVRNEIKRGTVTLYNGNIHRYKVRTGQVVDAEKSGKSPTDGVEMGKCDGKMQKKQSKGISI